MHRFLAFLRPPRSGMHRFLAGDLGDLVLRSSNSRVTVDGGSISPKIGGVWRRYGHLCQIHVGALKNGHFQGKNVKIFVAGALPLHPPALAGAGMSVLSVGPGRDAPFLNSFLRNEMHDFLMRPFLNARRTL